MAVFLVGHDEHSREEEWWEQGVCRQGVRCQGVCVQGFTDVTLGYEDGTQERGKRDSSRQLKTTGWKWNELRLGAIS